MAGGNDSQPIRDEIREGTSLKMKNRKLSSVLLVFTFRSLAMSQKAVNLRIWESVVALHLVLETSRYISRALSDLKAFNSPSPATVRTT